jgi:glycerol-3-phosphate acyltransferase PlsX
MRIAVDAMGGDFAPRNTVAGALAALTGNSHISRLFLVGDRARLELELNRLGGRPDCVDIIHASEVIEMHDPPVQSVRRKKDSSMSRAIDLVKSGAANAVVSAGNTGALLTAAHLKVPLNLLTTNVAKASPSTSSAMINNGLPVLAIFSSKGIISFMEESFFS